ncbi:MAG: M4 family metallopeptidase [Chitinophagaceae bacterium]
MNKFFYLFVFLLCLFSIQIQAQETNEQLLKIAKPNSTNEWILLKDDVNISKDEFLSKHIKLLHLAPSSIMKIVRTETDKLGFTNYRYQQYVHGVKAVGCEMILHQKNGRITVVNGRYLQDNVSNHTATFSEPNGLQIALKQINSKQYLWLDKEAEAAYKKTKKNAQATLYPKGELVFLNTEHRTNQKANFQLVWKYDINVSPLTESFTVFINANNGLFVEKIPLTYECSVGSGVTLYNGIRNISTQLNGGSYRTIDDCQSTLIETRNGNGASSGVGYTYYSDADNNWNFTALDQYITSAHWSAKQTHNYFFNIHGRNGYDNAGHNYISYLNPGFTGNAFWSSSTEAAAFGGSSTGSSPYVTLDVVGHEHTHGLVTFTSNLTYSYESGALNESFADCLGEAVEKYTLGTPDWIHRNEIGGGNRSFINPNSKGHPDTYLGTNWYTGTGDAGGVHTNSGVQNFWFYLLSVGGSGTNDNGHPYSVSGIGIDKAAAIAYRTLTVYLVASSQYADARTASIQAASDLYGACSNEVVQTTNAWRAVGVGAAYVATPLAITISSPQNFVCNNGSVTLTASGASTYVWSPGTVSGNSQTFSPTSSTTYTVVGTDADQCTGTATKTIHSYTSGTVSASASTNPVCFGNSSTMTALASTLNVGFTTPLPTPANFGQNFLLGVKITIPQGGLIEGLSLLGLNTNSNVQMALYTDLAGSPNTLVAQSNFGVVGNGVTTLAVSPAVPISGGDYWIMAVYATSGNHSNKSTAFNTPVYYTSLPFGNSIPTSASGFISYSGDPFNYWVNIRSNNITWSNGIMNGIPYTPTSSGVNTYSVTAIDAYGCTSTTSLNLNVIDLNTIPLSVSTNPICLGQTSAVQITQQTIFTEDFANNNQGWTLGTEWGIGPATASTGQSFGLNPDPSIDHTVSSDNGVAGVNIGGNASTSLHSAYYLTSPVINLSNLTSAHLNFWRWLNSDYTPYMQNTIEVYNGATWVTIWSSGPSPGIIDNAWKYITHNITPYINPNFQFRIGFSIGNIGVYTASSWNIDDVSITGFNNDPLTLNWTGTGGNISTPNIYKTDVTPVNDGINTYTISVADANGCTGTNTIDLTVNPLPVFTVSATPTTLCQNATATLTSNSITTKATLFSEDFSSNAQGWTLDTEWGIGSATASSGQISNTYPDPSIDHTPGLNNGVAGVNIGGNASTAIHAPYYLTSPVIDISSLTTATLNFWRWLNSDYTPYMQNYIEVFDGSTWQTIWSSGGSPVIASNSWSYFSYDISPYINTNFMVRFGHAVLSSGAYTVSSWNIDDISITGTLPSTPTWSGPASIVSPSSFITDVSPTVSGTLIYSISAKDTNGCVGSTPINLNVNSLPNVTANSTNPLPCDGTTTTLFGSGTASSYTWNGPIAVSDNVAFNASVASIGTYTVTGTDGFSCSNTNTIDIDVLPLPNTLVPTATPNTICLGASTTLAVEASTIYFSEDFSSNAQGWDLGTEWAIAPATASTGQNGSTYPDPGTDHTPTADNGIAGVSIGGNATTTLHSAYYLTSPVIDLSSVNVAKLSFWRWLNSDYLPYMQNYIEVYDGSAWVTVWSSGGSPVIADSSWNFFSYDISPYVNANFQVRFGHAVLNSGAYTVSSWNIDDLSIVGDNILWTGTSTIPNPTSLSNTITPTTDGLQSFTVSNTDLNGCVSTGSVNVLVNPLPNPTLTASPSTICAGQTATLSSTPTFITTTVFTEDFASNAQGWILGTEWGIGSATLSSGQNGGTLPDPDTDHTATSDNGIAGVVIGGNATTSIHAPYYITSPSINISSLTTAKLNFWRWLNSDYYPFMQNYIEVYDGSTWHTIWSSGGGPAIVENSWNFYSYDITPYINTNFQVRFGHAVLSGGVFTVSSWNIDDISISGTTPFVPTWTGPATINTPNLFTTDVTPTTSGTLTYSIHVTDTNGCSNIKDVTLIVDPCNNAMLDATYYIQGYYTGAGTMQSVLLNQGVAMATATETDYITVDLMHPTSYALVHTFTGKLNTDGTITCTYPATAVGNSYYIRVTHRNSVETWSSAPVAISTNTMYNFSTSATQAYGNNMIDVFTEGIWSGYNGDINQDGFIDIFDFLEWDADNQNFASGFFASDLSGDGIVDIFDFLIWDPNNQNFIGYITP